MVDGGKPWINFRGFAFCLRGGIHNGIRAHKMRAQCVIKSKNEPHTNPADLPGGRVPFPSRFACFSARRA
jgi:hypothetical protein